MPGVSAARFLPTASRFFPVCGKGYLFGFLRVALTLPSLPTFYRYIPIMVVRGFHHGGSEAAGQIIHRPFSVPERGKSGKRAANHQRLKDIFLPGAWEGRGRRWEGISGAHPAPCEPGRAMALPRAKAG
jgi:hypothetical protein